MAEDENSNYVFKNFPMHICYIEQEDVHLLDDTWAIKSKYLVSYQTSSYADKPRSYYEAVMNLIDSIDVNRTRENPTNASSIIFYSKCIIKKIIKPGTWGFDLTSSKIINDNNVVHRYNYSDYQKRFYDIFLYQNKKNKHT